MDSLIPVINDLQGIFQTTGVDVVQLPQIVVVGSQSCGKSSVLESLVRKSFLPRGRGIVTRCPVILQLVHSEKEEYCEFKGRDSGNQRYTDFGRLRKEIEKRTEGLAGSNKGISMEPIILQVVSPHVINLTLVDLPGIVKNPIGDQPHDIEDQVKNLIFNFIRMPQSIILAVSSATEDIANSESIKLAKAVDPLGLRTLGVLTKLDLMEKGTDANEVLDGSIINIKLGIVGVVNRSQIDAYDNRVEMSLVQENEYLKTNYPKYNGKIGSTYLSNKLNLILMTHIAQCLPDLRKRLTELIDESETKLQDMGPEIGEGAQAVLRVMLKRTSVYLETIRKAMNDRGELPLMSAPEKDMFAVQISESFQKLVEDMENNPSLLKDLSSKVKILLKQSVNFEGFASIEAVFKALVKQEIMLLEEPAIKCAKTVHDVLYKLAETAVTDHRFLKLNAVMCQAARDVFAIQLRETQNEIRRQLKIEASMIFTLDDEFQTLVQIGGPEVEESDDGDESETREQMKTVVEDLKLYVQNSFCSSANGGSSKCVDEDGDSCSSSKIKTSFRSSFPLTCLSTLSDDAFSGQCQFVELATRVYFAIVRVRIEEFVPKCIWFNFHECAIDKIEEELQNSTLGKEAELICESTSVSEMRKEVKELLQNLRRASAKINQIQVRS